MEVVRELLNRGARMDIENILGWTPIYAAAEEHHVEVVRGLLIRGARMDIKNEDGWTPICAAARESHVKVFRELLNRGARFTGARKPEYAASQSGHIEVVREECANFKFTSLVI